MTRIDKLIRKEKHKWIAEHVAGKTYVDIGGLWGTVNETVSLAALAGAKSYTMADIAPQGHRMWDNFDQHCEKLGITGYDKTTLDVCHLEQVSNFPKFDFVHCAGVIYHVSDPLQFIQNISTITNEYAIISSMTIPELIQSPDGELLSPVGTAHSVQALSDKSRSIARSFFSQDNLDPTVVDRGKYSDLFIADGRVNTGPWWWLYTGETLAAMCEVCNLEVLKIDISPNGAFSSVFCRVSQT